MFIANAPMLYLNDFLHHSQHFSITCNAGSESRKPKTCPLKKLSNIYILYQVWDSDTL